MTTKIWIVQFRLCRHLLPSFHLLLAASSTARAQLPASEHAPVASSRPVLRSVGFGNLLGTSGVRRPAELRTGWTIPVGAYELSSPGGHERLLARRSHEDKDEVLGLIRTILANEPVLGRIGQPDYFLPSFRLQDSLFFSYVGIFGYILICNFLGSSCLPLAELHPVASRDLGFATTAFQTNQQYQSTGASLRSTELDGWQTSPQEIEFTSCSGALGCLTKYQAALGHPSRVSLITTNRSARVSPIAWLLSHCSVPRYTCRDILCYIAESRSSKPYPWTTRARVQAAPR